MMSRPKILAIAPFVSFIAMFAYLFLLKSVGDPRAQDLRIDGSEMYVIEDIWLTITLIGIIIIWLRSLWRSFHLRQIGWLITIFLLWPAAAFYVWKKE